MDSKKLEKWAELLLDTGKRNNLINFKKTKLSSAEVIFPSANAIFEKIESSLGLEVFNPQDVDDYYQDCLVENIGGQGKNNVIKSKNEFLEIYADKIKKKNQILLYNSDANPISALRNIDKRAKAFIEETGVNVAYMAFGFIHWKEQETSNFICDAPILLVPISMEQSSALEPYTINFSDDEVIVNPTFSYKMDAEYGLKLPQYSDEGLETYLNNVEKIVSNLKWSVTSECKIGIFSFTKINMYRDLKDNAETILSNENIRRLLGESFDEEENTQDFIDEEQLNINNPLIDLRSVVDADSSQIEAIEMAKSGKSFVLQGPPGTGKSQTITNIIAECLNDDKTILFVSEKRAALNVVYEKLKNAGLSEFCLELHSHKANKKDVINEICHTLRTGKTIVSSKADEEISIKEKANKQLDQYAIELHTEIPNINKSLYQLYELYAGFRNTPDVNWLSPQLLSNGETYINEASLLLEQYVDYIPSVGYDYKNNPWYGYINQDNSIQSKEQIKNNLNLVSKLVEGILSVSKEIVDKYEIKSKSIDDASYWRNFFYFVSSSKLLTPALLKKNEFEITYSILNKMQDICQDIRSSRNILDSTFDADLYNLDGSALYKKLTKQFENSFSRLFDSEYRKLIVSLKLCKKDGKKPSYEEAVSSTQRLAFFQQKLSEYNELESQIKTYLGTAYIGVDTDWQYVMQQMEILKSFHQRLNYFGKLCEDSCYYSDFNKLKDYADEITNAFNICTEEQFNQTVNYFDGTIFNVCMSDCSLVLSRLKNCLNDFDKLDNLCYFRNLLSSLKRIQIISYIDEAISQNIEPKHIVHSFKKQMYNQWIDYILSNSPVLSSFNRISQDKAVNVFTNKDIEQFEINKSKIREKISAKRPSLDMIAAGSPLSVILREGEKKRKQKSIRTLIEETGDLIQVIKPCFLMSPLSVSTFLSSNSIHFDVVIFDEASQIFPQDAIGAIYRGTQLIVVGDSKQMPPSNFFSAYIEKDDNNEVDDVTDFESILDFCSVSMKQLRLRWHYRSRYEQLVTFSNKNFYDNDLITFPSSKADNYGIGVDYHYVDGIFDRKSHTNLKEAEYIVDLIYRNIEEYPNRSLGVVAFSVSQQNLIDRLLLKRRQTNPEKEYFFNNDTNEPFFIKNLETVQGDERDTIIFSIAYGFDQQGKLLHNFGPLNREGGERRLNVAVTRAKCNVQLVSSIHYGDIDLNRTSAEGSRLLREYLNFAENGSIALQRAVKVNSFEQFDSEFESEVCEFLQIKGFTVDTQVGCSGFKIDLGLRIPGSSDYVLAIECDGATYHSMKNARDRDRLRQEVLERMGWKFYRIWSTDWYRNKSVEKERLYDAAYKAINQTDCNDKDAENNKPTDVFEETVENVNSNFPVYQVADIDNLYEQYLPYNFIDMIKAILDVEAPLSEEFLLRRIVRCFGREKVTNVVQREYDQLMYGCQNYGIVRKNGFLYLNNVNTFQLRVPGEITREIKHIAPEELASGMLEIVRQNLTVDKNALFHLLAKYCGYTRVGNSIHDYFDSILYSISNDVVISDDLVSLK